MNIAIILTCFNRKEKTLLCLSSLFNALPACEVYLVDDASTDGTPEAIKDIFPQVNIINGTGNLYWSRGMYTAWKEALKNKYDYYLWLNDDLELYPDFFEELMQCYKWGKGNCIISGMVENLDRTMVIYGGSDICRKKIQPSSQPQEITYMNGNVVLISQSIVDKIGIIDPFYHHSIGDVDYGFTAKKAGIKVLTTTRPIAMGCDNSFCRERKWDTTLTKRFKFLYSPLGSNPTIIFHFKKKHFGIINATIYWLFLHVINVFPDFFVEKIWGDTYKD